jgi:hypothetical protein
MAYFKKLKAKTSQEIEETPTISPEEVQEKPDNEEKLKQDLIPTPPPPTPQKVKARQTSQPKLKRKRLMNHEIFNLLEESDTDFGKELKTLVFGQKGKHKRSNKNRYRHTVLKTLDWLREEDVI